MRRLEPHYARLLEAADPVSEIRFLSDEQVVDALAHAARAKDDRLASVLATEAANRMSRATSVANEATRERERTARIVLDSMYQFVALLDVQGNLLDVNKTALEGGGIRLEDIVGRPFWEAHWWGVTEETKRRLRDAVREAASGRFVRYEAEVWGGERGKGLIWIDFSIRPVRGPDGRVALLLPEGRNITEMKRAEAELARKNEELSTLNRRLKEFDELKTQFFANVSHELRTPLALILGPAEEVARADNVTPAQRRDLEVVASNARVLLKHVNDLLDVAKLESGRIAPRYADVDLARLVRVTAANFDALAAERGIDWRVEAPPALPAQVDPDMMRRVLANLLSNAFKFTPAGGTVRVVLEHADAPPGERPRARLTVRDSGPGIPEERREAVFERFRQLEGGTTRRFGGTGLGLAIAKDFTDLHGGGIRVEGAPEGGAVLVVEVPVAAPSDARVEPPRDEADEFADGVAGAAHEVRVQTALDEAPATGRGAAAAGADRPLVLVVEDNPEMNRFVARAFEREGYAVATAPNGREGLRKAHELRPDLVVSDVMMPEMSGDEMARRMRAEAELEDVPILLLTAKADDALRDRLLRDGVQDWVTKPFGAAELLARAANLVTVKRARDALQGELASTLGDLEVLTQEIVRRKRVLETEVRERAAAEHALAALNLDLERRVTERTRDLAEANRRLANANAELESFNYTVSHDLRAPLRGLDALTRILVDEVGGVLPPDLRDVAERLRAESSRASRLVEDLLALSRVGRSDLRRDRVDLAALAREVADRLKRGEPHREVEVVVPDRDGALEADADPALAHVVMENLVENAWKYTRREARARIEVGVEETPSGERVFFVRDNGAGFDPALASRLFAPFQRLHTPQEFEGTGVGLATVRRIVERHGGRAWAESAGPGKGATVRFTLPS